MGRGETVARKRTIIDRQRGQDPSVKMKADCARPLRRGRGMEKGGESKG